jgi:hypothetical protein
MDTVISLRAHLAEEGAVPGHKDVEVHITKGRNLPPNASQPFIATLAGQDGAMAWEYGDLAQKKTAQIEELLRMGMPISQVVLETGCASSLAYRVKDRLSSAGAIKWKGSGRGRKARSDIDG